MRESPVLDEPWWGRWHYLGGGWLNKCGAMPKKFKGENSKAAAARERKQAAKQEADERKRRAEEDAYWKDDDKHAQRKQDRRVQNDTLNYLEAIYHVDLWAALQTG